MDVPAQPVLLDLTTQQGSVPALVGPTKQGDIYVLDRRTGLPSARARQASSPLPLRERIVTGSPATV
jgi:quinoprotein glucose dehydrogenase